MAGFDQRVRMRSVEDYLVAAHGSARTLTIDELDVIDRHASAVVESIEDAWPVDTSTSRDAFFHVLLDDPEIGYVVSNDADYAEWVHPKGDPVPLLDTLVPDTIEADVPALAAELRLAIDATERRAAENARRGGRGFLDIVSRRFGAGRAA